MGLLRAIGHRHHEAGAQTVHGFVSSLFENPL